MERQNCRESLWSNLWRKTLSGLKWLRKGQTANIYGHNGDLSYVIKMGTLTKKVTVSCPRIIYHWVPSKKKGDNIVNVLNKIYLATVHYVKAYKNERTKRELTVSQLVLNCSANWLYDSWYWTVAQYTRSDTLYHYYTTVCRLGKIRT
jgi:hypothetical protein